MIEGRLICSELVAEREEERDSCRKCLGQHVGRIRVRAGGGAKKNIQTG